MCNLVILFQELDIYQSFSHNTVLKALFTLMILGLLAIMVIESAMQLLPVEMW